MLFIIQPRSDNNFNIELKRILIDNFNSPTFPPVSVEADDDQILSKDILRPAKVKSVHDV